MGVRPGFRCGYSGDENRGHRRPGARKDFVDLRILCGSGLTLETIFDLFERKYGTRRTDRYHRLRALAYFEDAEQEPMPDLLSPFDSQEAKRFFAAEAARLLAALTA